MGKKKPEEIELMEHRAIVEVPEDALEIEIVAKVYHGGKLIDVGKKYNQSQIREIFRKADDGYIDDDDVFTLTDKGREYLDYLEGLK